MEKRTRRTFRRHSLLSGGIGVPETAVADVQTLPVFIPVLGEGHGEVTVKVLERVDDEIDRAELSDRLEPLGGDVGLHAALGRLEVLREHVAGADVLRVEVRVGGVDLGGGGEDVDQEGLEEKETKSW